MSKRNYRHIKQTRAAIRRGIGPLYFGRSTELLSTRHAKVLSRARFDDTEDQYCDSYDLVTRVKLPVAMVKATPSQIGCYLADQGVISTAHCTHQYDCCGCFYPAGRGRILERHGRELLVTQTFNRNV